MVPIPLPELSGRGAWARLFTCTGVQSSISHSDAGERGCDVTGVLGCVAGGVSNLTSARGAVGRVGAVRPRGGGGTIPPPQWWRVVERSPAQCSLAWARDTGILAQGFSARSDCTTDWVWVAACLRCSMLGHTALGVCLLLLATLGHTPYAQSSPPGLKGRVAMSALGPGRACPTAVITFCPSRRCTALSQYEV